MKDDTMDQLSRTFAALADPTRRDLVARLTAGDASVTELAVPYAMSLQAVSKHLSVLERAGLVSKGRDAQRRPVHLEAEVLAPVTDWLEEHRRLAEERFTRLDAVLTELAVEEAYPQTAVFARPPRTQALGAGQR
jgi:DNA-binding transcriptional ArsR family regulator